MYSIWCSIVHLRHVCITLPWFQEYILEIILFKALLFSDSGSKYNWMWDRLKHLKIWAVEMCGTLIPTYNSSEIGQLMSFLQQGSEGPQAMGSGDFWDYLEEEVNPMLSGPLRQRLCVPWLLLTWRLSRSECRKIAARSGWQVWEIHRVVCYPQFPYLGSWRIKTGHAHGLCDQEFLDVSVNDLIWSSSFKKSVWLPHIHYMCLWRTVWPFKECGQRSDR